MLLRNMNRSCTVHPFLAQYKASNISWPDAIRHEGARRESLVQKPADDVDALLSSVLSKPLHLCHVAIKEDSSA